MAFKGVVYSAMIILLFASLMIGFAANTGNVYGKDIGEFNSNSLNMSGINSTLDDAQAKAEEWKDKFTEQKTIIGETWLIMTGIFSLSLTMFEFVIDAFGIIFHILTDILRIPSIVIGTLIFGLIIGTIFAIVKLIKTGN